MAPSSRLLATALMLFAPPRFASAQRPGVCDLSCTYQLTDATNVSHSYDLRPLCNTTHDYTLNDTVGHSYFANICGSAQAYCAPLK